MVLRHGYVEDDAERFFQGSVMNDIEKVSVDTEISMIEQIPGGFTKVSLMVDSL